MTTRTTPQDLVATARTLRPDFERYTSEAERLRRLPDGLVGLLRDSGFFGMSRPPERGGLGVDLRSALRAVEEISIADASAGWCTAIASGSIGEPPLRDDVAREIFKPRAAVCGVGAPSGRAVPVGRRVPHQRALVVRERLPPLRMDLPGHPRP